jgi:hypothetical protein
VWIYGIIFQWKNPVEWVHGNKIRWNGSGGIDGNKSLLDEHNDFRYRCEDFQAELAGVCSNAEKRTADLESRVKSAEAHSTDIAAAGEKQLRDFEGGLI